jgi:hypothetical protein
MVVGLGPISGDAAIPAGWFEVFDDDHTPLAWGRIEWSLYNIANGETWPACGDIDGDGADEIIMGLGSGGNGWLETFDYTGGKVVHKSWLQVNWAAYNTANGETRPTCGDIDGDGKDEIVVGLGPVAGSASTPGGWFEVFDDEVHLSWGRTNWSLYNSANGETRPVCGDLDGDAVDEIVVGLGTGGEGWLQIFNYTLGSLGHTGWLRLRWDEYNTADGATRPASGDIDGDGKDEIVVGLTPAGSGYMEVFDDATSQYAHIGWDRVSWSTYISANGGETWPAVKE